MAIILTGNPGVGKHTISKRIIKMHDLEILDINKIAIKSKVVEESKETLDVDVKKLKGIIVKKISKKTLLVGHLAPYVITKTTGRYCYSITKKSIQIRVYLQKKKIFKV